MLETVATAGFDAVIKASIGIALVSVVADLNTCLHMPITAARHLASAETAIRVIGIAIIAILDPSKEAAVSTAGFHTVIQASIGLIGIAIVTGFNIQLHMAVAAAR